MGGNADWFARYRDRQYTNRGPFSYNPISYGTTASQDRGPFTGDPVDLATNYINESLQSRTRSREAQPDVFESYLRRINRGTLTPQEASINYLDYVRATGGNLKEGILASDQLADVEMGMMPTEKYDRYRPAASLAFEKLLGRGLGDAEYKNLVSAAQGLGISQGKDFQDFLGRTLLASPEYKSKAVIFNPNKVMKAIEGSRSGPSMQEYMSMLS